jgi:flagellar biosynthesis/type III secretory pathway chaperone
MITRLRNLSLCLERMAKLYERAIDLLEKEKACLVNLDFETLTSHLREKDEILAALKALDKDRLRVQDQFAILWDRDTADLTLKSLAEGLLGMGPELEIEGQKLLRKRKEILSLTQKLKDRILLNEGFIEKSIENVRGLAEYISETLTGQPGVANRKGGIYTGKAQYKKTTEHKGSILHKTF